jgi:hypothetical protein
MPLRAADRSAPTPAAMVSVPNAARSGLNTTPMPISQTPRKIDSNVPHNVTVTKVAKAAKMVRATSDPSSTSAGPTVAKMVPPTLPSTR